jgi:hypothetical protein
MRNVEYITNGFGGWADFFTSTAFKQMQYDSSPSGAYGASLQTKRTSPADEIQKDILNAGYPQSLASIAYSLVNRYGPTALRAPYRFVSAFRTSMFDFSRSPAGNAIFAQLDRLGVDQPIPLQIAGIVKQEAEKSFKSAFSAVGNAQPYNQAVQTFLTQIVNYTISRFGSNLTLRQLDQMDLRNLYHVLENFLSRYKSF